jgi:tetratricopeptide (TPR) repeat protein
MQNTQSHFVAVGARCRRLLLAATFRAWVLLAVLGMLVLANHSARAADAPQAGPVIPQAPSWPPPPGVPVVATGAQSNTPTAPPVAGLLPTGETLPANLPGSLTGVASPQSPPAVDPQALLTLARQQRLDKNAPLAGTTLQGLLDGNPPTEFKRLALFEMALVAQDEAQYVRAEQIFAQYLHLYGDDPSAPDVLLRQGLIYRQMGVSTLAVSKFYAVMSTCLKLKLDNMDYYKKLVLQAQIEIADTYYLEGSYLEASDYFNRLSKMDSPQLDQTEIQFKLIRSLSYLTNYSDTIAKAQVFLDIHATAAEIPEVRFILASALKQIGRNQDATKQVLLLLQTEQRAASDDPETWIYWQQRAGNEIANQFYKEGDYLDALQIYTSLSDLDKSPAWQLPVWYQTGLVYEQLLQWQRANDTYQRILDRRNELTGTNSTPSLLALIDMAGWRKNYIGWLENARAADQAFKPTAMASTPPPTHAPASP